jgi:type II secretory pathway pseudopilin PulG
MKRQPPTRTDPALSLPGLAAALVAIMVLALVLPTFAVRTLHARRLEEADLELRLIAEALAAAAGWARSEAILAGPGDRPPGEDQQWNHAAVLPLTGAAVGIELAVAADPWGNAYLVKSDAESASSGWVLSAGPDGVLQTPFQVRDRPLGDDRGARVR